MRGWSRRLAPRPALPCLANRRRQRPRSGLGGWGRGANPSELSREAGREKSDPHPKLTNLPRRGVGRAGWLRGAAGKRGGGTGQSRGGRPDREPECRGPRAAADPAPGKRRAPREAESCGGAAEREAGPECGARRSQTERAAQTGKWLRPPPSASPSSEKTGLKGTPGTSGSRPSPTADPPLLPSTNAFNPHPFSSPHPPHWWVLSESPTLSILHPIPPPLFP